MIKWPPMNRIKGFPPLFWLGAVALLAILALLLLLLAPAGLRVTSVSPAAGNDQVPLTTLFQITFSHDVDAASAEAHFRVEPELAGNLSVEGRQVTFRPQPAWEPGQAYTVTLQAGVAATSGRVLAEDHTWSFLIRSPQLLYLARTAPALSGDEVRQLFVASPDAAGDAPGRQLTAHPGGVWDYAVHPRGEAIVYSMLREDGGSDLWWMDRDGEEQRLLLACPDMACLAPAWSPDGTLIVYEQRDIWADAPNLDPKAGQLWLLDLQADEKRPLFDYAVPLHSPQWAPEGQRLAYLSPLASGVEVLDLPTDELFQFGNQWGATPAWSPDGQYLALSELMLAGESMVVHLLRVDIEAGRVLDISGQEETVQDVAPAWSPGGGWIAFGRQFLDVTRWTPGHQIWLARPDGSEAYPLLEEAMADHFALAWRPDGASLAYVRNDLSEGPQPAPDVQVWVFDLVRRQPTLVAKDAVLPGWLP
jgi:Tol biopolymer transport system component